MTVRKKSKRKIRVNFTTVRVGRRWRAKQREYRGPRTTRGTLFDEHERQRALQEMDEFFSLVRHDDDDIPF